MMSVMKGMHVQGRQGDTEPDQGWNAAVAEWEAGEPAELERPPRKVTILYRYIDGRFEATSPGLAGFEVHGRSLHETKQLVRADLAGYLDPSVELHERMPAQGPDTEGASRQVLCGSDPLVVSPVSNLVAEAGPLWHPFPWKPVPEATLVLCDFAETDSSGKVHMLGAGWSFMGPDAAPQAVVGFIQVPPDRLGSPIPVTVRLLDSAHQVVEVPGAAGLQRLEISGQIEMQEP
jgi:hypothetical protein